MLNSVRSFGWLYSDFMEALSSYIALLFPRRIPCAKVDFINMPYSKFWSSSQRSNFEGKTVWISVSRLPTVANSSGFPVPDWRISVSLRSSSSREKISVSKTSNSFFWLKLKPFLIFEESVSFGFISISFFPFVYLNNSYIPNIRNNFRETFQRSLPPEKQKDNPPFDP